MLAHLSTLQGGPHGASGSQLAKGDKGDLGLQLLACSLQVFRQVSDIALSLHLHGHLFHDEDV